MNPLLSDLPSQVLKLSLSMAMLITIYMHTIAWIYLSSVIMLKAV